MPRYGYEADYREELTEEEEAWLRRADNPREAIVELYVRRAEKQFAAWNVVVPEYPELMRSYPGVDPVGKHSMLEVQAAEQEARIEAALQYRRTDHILNYVRELRENPILRDIKDQFLQESQKIRLLYRAERLCPDERVKQKIYVEARQREKSLPVVQYTAFLDGMEYIAGVKEGPIPEDVRNFYAQTLHLPLDEELLRVQAGYKQPEKLQVEFENLEHILLQHQIVDPRNWGKTAEEAVSGQLTENEVEEFVAPYARATADRLLNPLFRPLEKLGSGEEISRADLIIVDGKTVRERLFEDYRNRPIHSYHDYMSFDDYCKANCRAKTNEYVAAGLMAGKRVEAFVPNEKGELPKEPTQITKTGYAPTSLQPVVLNAWQRFWAKLGFYKEKVSRAVEYQRMAEARERVRITNFTKRLELLGGDQVLRKQFTCGWEQSNGRKLMEGDAAYDAKIPSLGICYLLCQGKKLEDIFDPNALQAEKAEVGKRAIDAVMSDKWGKGDHVFMDWTYDIGAVMAKGHHLLMQQMGELSQNVDFSNYGKLCQPENSLLFLAAAVAGDISKERENCWAEYDAGARFLYEEKQFENTGAWLNDRMSGTSSYLETVRKSMVAGVTLAGGMGAMNNGVYEHMTPILASEAVRQQMPKMTDPAQRNSYLWVNMLRETDPEHVGMQWVPEAVSKAANAYPNEQMRQGNCAAFMNGLNEDIEAQKAFGQAFLNGRMQEQMKVNLNPEITQHGREASFEMVPLSQQAAKQAENDRQVKEIFRQNEAKAAKPMGGDGGRRM